MPVFQPNTAISHAYALICADEAQRARETTELAAAMLCTSDGVRPCRVCRDCKKVFRGVHPDVICTDPVHKMMGNISKGRKQERNLSRAPTRSRSIGAPP